MGFFKSYDMRGTFGVDFDLDTVYRVGKALPQVVKGRRWLIGRDCRTTSEAVREKLARGLAEAGVEVADLGQCTTPMLYFFTAEDDYDGSVMITASHNPPSDNGLKVSMRSALPVGYANGLCEVERIVKAQEGGECPEGGHKSFANGCDPDRLERYLQWQREHSTFDLGGGGLRFAVDCSNGMASLFAREMFPGAMLLNDTLDGTFPCHSPNPLNAAAREELSRTVRESGLDCGVIFDGDADRAMFVDERGEFVQPDYLIPVIARATLSRNGGGGSACRAKVLHDVRTSRGAIEALRDLGCEPVMVPVGHAFAKPMMRKLGSLCGGELAGHYYFGEFFGCDSGLLAATRVLGEVAAAKRAGKTFSAMMAPIAGRYANSGELNFRIEDKDAAIERVLAAARSALPPETGRSDLDGIRVEFAEGWFNIRKSNTEPYLRMLIECDTAVRLAEWRRLFERAIGT